MTKLQQRVFNTAQVFYFAESKLSEQRSEWSKLKHSHDREEQVCILELKSDPDLELCDKCVVFMAKHDHKDALRQRAAAKRALLRACSRALTSDES
jgi:hypothetical protein